MLNQIVLVGRLTQKPTKKRKSNKESEMIILSLEVPTNHKDANGEYIKDYINVRVYGGLVKTLETANFNKGDMIGVKGKLKCSVMDDIMAQPYVICEKITYLSSKKEDE